MSEVTVFSATKLSTATTNLVTDYIIKKFGEKNIHFVIDKNLIAGIKIVKGDKQIELSLDDLLTALGQSLTT